MSEDVGARISAEMTSICKEIPERLNIQAILLDAHKRLTAAAGDTVLPSSFWNDKLQEVLREIASHTVEEFTRRTGQPFLWVDEPDLSDLDGGDVLMHFSLDEKGHVRF